MRLTWLRVSSLLRDGHRNKRQTTSAPPDPPKSSPFRVKILCLVLVVRRRRRSSGVLHHSRGKHDFNDDNNTPLVFFYALVFLVVRGIRAGRSSLCFGARSTRKQCEERNQVFFCCFFYPNFFWYGHNGTWQPKAR